MERKKRINFDPRLIEARVNWENHLNQLRNKGIGGDQLWPFPENIKDTKRQLKEAQLFLLEHPENIRQGGFFEPYRNHLENLLDIYGKIDSARSERLKTNWILGAGIVAAVGGVVASIGGVDQIRKWILELIRIIFDP